MEPCCPELEVGFDERMAARDLAAYRRDGLPPDHRRLLAALRSDGLEGRTVLDIGGGVGAIHHELLRLGVASITDVDGSTAYLDIARAEAHLREDVDRISYQHGDFVELAEGIEPADIVTLLRVLCCYRDMPALVRASTSRALRSYGVIYPRSAWWMRAAATAFDRLRPLTGPAAGPGWVHLEREVDQAVRAEGFVPVVVDSTWYWRIALYRRVEGSSAKPAYPGRSRSPGPM
ncbi:MAG: class I SAM-dependent methyltransferase [Chloroflexota bacterium]